MILKRLVEYADNRMELPPPMYGGVAIRWFIDLAPDGRLEGFAPLGGDTKSNKNGQLLTVPTVRRAAGIKPRLLADNSEYVLGDPRRDSSPSKVSKVEERHRQFVELVESCAEATREPSVEAVRRFLDSWTFDADLVPDNLAPTDTLTFRVGSVVPAAELTSVQEFWADYTSGTQEKQSEDPHLSSICLVTGEVGPVEERMPVPVKGLLQIGGKAENSLVSANEKAFESYGLESSLTSPISRSAGERFGKALNSLLSNERTRIYVGPLVYVFWTREESSFGLDLMDRPDPQRVRELFKSPYTGTEQHGVQPNKFYALALSASGGRAVVRDWLETTVPEAEEHLKRWFRAQKIVDSYGKEDADPLRLYTLAASAYFDANKEMTPQVPAALVHAAIEGGRLPDDLLARAVRRNRAEGDVTRPRAALMKLVLSYRRGGEELTENLEKLDLDHPEPAYHCGRLLAELEALQVAAIRGVKATLVDRYYGSASSAPASVFGTLMRSSNAHLGKLRKEQPAAEAAIQRRMEEISTSIGGTFPRTLTLQQQAIFALGYYHQRAHDRAERRKPREEES